MTRLDIRKLHAKYGPKVPSGQFGRNWYQHVTYGYHDGQNFVTLPGRIQIKKENNGTNCITINSKGYCVRGWDVKWLAQEAGYEAFDSYRTQEV